MSIFKEFLKRAGARLEFDPDDVEGPSSLRWDSCGLCKSERAFMETSGIPTKLMALFHARQEAESLEAELTTAFFDSMSLK
jgi:hypothetical protein